MIRLKKGYSLFQIKGTHYLLPYGQNIAEHRHSMRLNDATLLFYEPLARGTDRAELLALLAEHYQAAKEDIPALEADISSFLAQMNHFHMLEHALPRDPADAGHVFQIGPAIVGYHGPNELLHPSLYAFTAKQDVRKEPSFPDLMLYVSMCAPDSRAIGDILIRTEELTICRTDDYYLFLYPAGYGILEAKVATDGSAAVFFCDGCPSFDLREKLFHAMRFAYLILAQRLGCFVVHSASILYRDKAWLFSGPSGTGKSTHAALWQRLYRTKVLNGDLNLLAVEQDLPMVYGLPWCGTSNQFTAKTYPLGGITFLQQACADTLRVLPPKDGALRLMQRLISPSWTAELLAHNVSFAELLSDKTTLFHLQCTKQDHAAEVMRAAVDAVII